jgi:peptide chain release factor 1
VHLPTGIEVYCVEERRQMENRARALASLEQKLYNIAYEEQLNKRQQNRKMQVGSSGRSERIRTYNFLQDRITDHRLDENFVGVNKFLSGETLETLVESLKTEQKIEILYEILNKK